MHRFVLLLSGSMLLFCDPLAAQTIGGWLLDRERLNPIPAATVVLLDAEDAERGGVLTDSTGAFSLRAGGGALPAARRADRLCGCGHGPDQRRAA
ncbi:MAG TPA: carboxypeptidase-like regulatory domain-containing protein [Longimicrobiaceae bacterium]|nr:carboxypeptidase-like regulatory domain-containing protein [Longimicrobiaceae bacterium]